VAACRPPGASRAQLQPRGGGPLTRLSVAVRPPQAVRDRLADLPRESRPGLTWSVPEQWIVKLRPLGHVAEHLVGPLGDVLEAALDGAPAPTCTLGPMTVRPAGSWLYAPVAGLDELADEVFAATEHLVPVTHPQPYRGALVLARGRVPADVAGAPIDATWQAEEVVLVADRSGPGRPRLVTLTAVRLELP
jgi:2'-5' RNA ligase